MSRIVVSVQDEPDWYAYVPALCLAAAATQRPRLADHIGGLPALKIVALDFAGASAVGDLVREHSVGWQLARAIHLGRPTVDWPDGRPIVTARPEAYVDHQVATIPLTN